MIVHCNDNIFNGFWDKLDDLLLGATVKIKCLVCQIITVFNNFIPPYIALK